jgi:fatty-acyl-CoA synthase
VSRQRPDAVAFIHRDVQTTFAEVAARVDRLAHALRDHGVDRGDRVAYLGNNSAAMLEVLFATARLGAVIVPLNTRLAPRETAYILGDCTPSLLAWGPPFGDTVTDPIVAALGIPTVEVGEQPRTGELETWLQAGDPAPLDEPVGHGDLFMIQYTSGTSGHPKGVMLSHGNVTWNALHAILDVDLTIGTVSLVAAPLFHTASLNMHFLPTFLKGGTAVIEEGWRPDRVLELIERHRVTYVSGVTAMYQSLMTSPLWDGTDLSSVTVAMSGGSPLPESLLAAYAARGIAIAQAYGLTEASPGATILRPADTVRKLGSAGLPHTFGDLRIVRPDRTTADPGEVGEILVQGPTVTAGYWDNATATAAAFSDGVWLRTGDLARVDDEGYVYIVDRLKDMIISGGENVYPAEVEKVIIELPGVADVAVIGIADDKWGEVPRAVVQLKAGAHVSEGEILEHMQGRLARYKQPKTVRFIEEFPRTASGKIRKNQLRDNPSVMD